MNYLSRRGSAWGEGETGLETWTNIGENSLGGGLIDEALVKNTLTSTNLAQSPSCLHPVSILSPSCLHPVSILSTSCLHPLSLPILLKLTPVCQGEALLLGA